MNNIVIYTNMAPSPEIEYAGIFVKNQYDYLKRHDKGNNYSLLAMPKTFTGLLGSIKKYFLFIIKSFSSLNKENIDLIHIHYFFPLAIIPWFIKKIRGTKIVVTVHGSDFYAKMNNRVIRFIYTKILRDCDYIICVGEQLAVDFESKIKLKPDKILCAGIDREIFLFKPGTTKEFDFLFVGTLTERKGIDIVLKTIEQTINEKYKWCIVGTGAYKKKVLDLMKNFPQSITYFEKLTQKELTDIYNKSKWFFFPSRNEPFGLVASECIFSGTPVISSASGGLKEQVKDNYNGYIISDPTNLVECKNTLEKCMAMPDVKYSELVENCLKNSDFSLDAVCNELTVVYKSLLKV